MDVKPEWAWACRMAAGLCLVALVDKPHSSVHQAVMVVRRRAWSPT